MICMKNVEKALNDDLQKCNNMEQVLKAIEKHYDLHQPFGFATKIIVINGVKKILEIVKAKPKITIL